MIFSPTFRATTNDAAGLWNRIHSFVRISWLAIFPLVVLASPSVTLAQATHFTSTIWRSQDGLPENIVQALVQDREGYLWVGTTGGLTEFDGSRFNPLTDGTTQ